MSEETLVKRDHVLVVVKFLVPVLLAVSGWTLVNVLNNGTRLTAIEANRFTATDGSEMMHRLIELKGSLPDEIPPAWFKAEVDTLKAELKEIRVELRDLRERSNND